METSNRPKLEHGGVEPAEQMSYRANRKTPMTVLDAGASAQRVRAAE